MSGGRGESETERMRRAEGQLAAPFEFLSSPNLGCFYHTQFGSMLSSLISWSYSVEKAAPVDLAEILTF